jgi:hypothetical protein
LQTRFTGELNAVSVPSFKSAESLKKQSFGLNSWKVEERRGKTYMQQGQSLHSLHVYPSIRMDA